MVQCPFSRAAHSVFLLLGLSFGAHGDSTSPKGILFINDGIGPDGPWNYLSLFVDSPDQNLAFYPSMLETPLIVNATACRLQTAQCPLPTLTAWEGSAAHNFVNDKNSAPWDPSNLTSLNGGYVTELMSLEGELRYISQRFTYGTQDGIKYLDNTATAVADNVTVAYPGGSWYTLGIGYISLYGGGQFTYDLPNGTDWTLELQLHNGFVLGAYPSMSYGLHMGSALHNVSGKLYFGGYDRARCIGEPIAVEYNSTFSLAEISVGVAEGGSAFLNNTANATEITGLLQSNSSTLPLSTQPDPGLPYLYLPPTTCNAIADYLPVSYDAYLGLYLWNTSAPEFESIISSPHYLSFHFHTSGTSGATQSIEIPFALFNLTLNFPIVDNDTQYFPCRPYTPPDSSYPSAVLGRAFLQGAHLAQNWETGYVWLAQAPGPSHADEDLKTIDSDSTTLAQSPAAGLWNSTWDSVLTPLSGITTGSSSGSTASNSASAAGDSSGTDNSGLSPGAKAGIGVGAALGGLALIGLIGWIFVWKRCRAREEAGATQPAGEIPNHAPMEPQELEAPERQELPVEGHGVDELHGEASRQELPGKIQYRQCG